MKWWAEGSYISILKSNCDHFILEDSGSTDDQQDHRVWVKSLENVWLRTMQLPVIFPISCKAETLTIQWAKCFSGLLTECQPKIMA